MQHTMWFTECIQYSVLQNFFLPEKIQHLYLFIHIWEKNVRTLLPKRGAKTETTKERGRKKKRRTEKDSELWSSDVHSSLNPEELDLFPKHPRALAHPCTNLQLKGLVQDQTRNSEAERTGSCRRKACNVTGSTSPNQASSTTQQKQDRDKDLNLMGEVVAQQ